MKFKHEFKLVSKNKNTIIYKADNVLMRLDFIENILRVALIKDEDNLIPTFSICPNDYKMPSVGRDKLSIESFNMQDVETFEKDGHLFFKHCDIDFDIDLENFRIKASNDLGILYSDRSGLAYNFNGELGDNSYHYTLRYENQKIYGLGDKCGHLNKNLQAFKLSTSDSMGFKAKNSDPLYKHMPFYICENDYGTYGLYYDTYSNGEISFGKEHDNYFEPYNYIHFEEDNLVYYLLLGDIKKIIQTFNSLTGGICELPEWAFRYCGSTMEYTDGNNTENDLKNFLDKCNEYEIKPGGFYLSSGYTQIKDKRYVFNWNKDKIQDPKELANYFKQRDVHIIPNVKPAFLNDHPMYESIAKNGWFLHYKDGSPALFPFWGGYASYLDFTNPDAYNFWKECVKEKLVAYGYENIWNDNNEYDVFDKDVLACGFGKEIPARLIRPLFPLLMTSASRQAYKDSNLNEIPFMVTRSACAGYQRIATTWTGDNYTDFKDLRFNHYQAMTMSLSGLSFFGQDIGGFYGPKPSKELFIRWIQYGLFTPRFVLHSWKEGEPSTMPWLYEDLKEEVKALFKLREELLPYIIKEYEVLRKDNLPLIYPVFLKDKDYEVESDYFMLGRSIFVCPIFDEGIDEITITLPKSETGWLLRSKGEVIKGSKTLKVKCTINDLPIWFIEKESIQ